MRIQFTKFVVLLAVMSGASGLAHAQYPNRPIRLVINFAAGGTSDIIARSLQQELATALGQPITIENVTGALGAIGAATVARAQPDGYTILLTTQGALTEIPALQSNLSYDPLTAFSPVTLIAKAPLLLAVHPSLPVNDFTGFIEYAKLQPGGVDFAVTGSSVRLAGAMLARDAKIKLVDVVYRGAGPALTAVLSGEVKVFLNTGSETLNEYVSMGKLKLLGITSAQPTDLIPGGVPIARTLPAFSYEPWWGIFAPAGTPKEIITTLNAAFKKAIGSPGMAEKFARNIVAPLTSTPEELTARVAKELAETRALVEAEKITFQ